MDLETAKFSHTSAVLWQRRQMRVSFGCGQRPRQDSLWPFFWFFGISCLEYISDHNQSGIRIDKTDTGLL